MSYISTHLGDDGIQLCDIYSSSHGSVKCSHRLNGCSGLYTIDCHPDGVWSGTPTGGSSYYYYSLNSGSFYGPNFYDAYAFSSRCVLEKFSERYSSYGGGGGGGAPYLKNYTIPQDVIDANVGGKIRMYAAGGGSGGVSLTGTKGSKGNPGSYGQESYIYVLAPGGAIKWGYRTPGGAYGAGAKSDSYGAGGNKIAASSCRISENGTSCVATDCSGYGPNGADGASRTNISASDAAQGGTGGGSAYNYYSYTGGGAGGNSSNESGQDGSRYGAGGGGGTVRIVVSGSTVSTYAGAGGKGANGAAEITYDMVYPAAAGGGGGGGAFAKVTDLAVVPEKKYTIRVGGGGNGGGVSNIGGSGGASSITFGSVTYSLDGGRGGAAGVSATQSSLAAQGVGGSGGIVYSNVSDKSNLEHKNGEAGTNAQSFEGSSIGGIGGTSGILTKGGCGGLFIDSAICTNNGNVDGITIDFVKPKDLYKTAPQYGKAGAGGGGGGWSENTASYPDPGGGGSGQNGYVYIYWTKN